MISITASAKINLTFEVLGRREDGYHRVVTVLQEIDLRDTLTFEEADDISVHCEHPWIDPSRNLVLEAAGLLREESGAPEGAHISLEKGIPVSSGLGGGSSDAAATLVALDRLWGLGLTPERLTELASRLGTDTAFFVRGGTALAEGRGESITPLPPLPAMWLVLFRPPIDAGAGKTGRLYSCLEPSHYSDGRRTRELVAMLRQGERPSPAAFCNAFDDVAFAAFAGIERYWELLRGLGAEHIHLAGSGPTLYTAVGDEAAGEALCRSLAGDGLEAYLVPTVERR